MEINTKKLVLHPYNTIIYGEVNVDDLITSISENGIIVPLIITPDYKIISGTRRWTCASEIGIELVPCEIKEFENEDDEILAIVEYNRYRVKKPLEIYNESREVKRILSARAEEKILAGVKDPTPKPEEGRSIKETDSQTAKQYGMGKTKFRQIEEIFEKAEEFPDIAKKVADEKTSVYQGYRDLKKREARKRLAENPPEESDELTLFKHLEYAPKPWDIWVYNRDKIYGLDWPGSIPAGIVFNTLYFYTEPGDLVVDPMAGGGVVGDVCRVTERECRMFDVVPGRSDIESHDLRDGFPVEDADLVFLDPPYYKKMEKDYGPDSISAMDRAEYLEFFETLALSIHDSGAKRVALLMSDYTDDDNPEGHIFIWHYVDIFEACGWIPIRHIMAPISTTAVHPDFVVKFRKSKKLARLGRSLVIFERK